MKKLMSGKGQIFQSAEAFRQMICKYAIVNHFNYRLRGIIDKELWPGGMLLTAHSTYVLEAERTHR